MPHVKPFYHVPLQLNCLMQQCEHLQLILHSLCHNLVMSAFTVIVVTYCLWRLWFEYDGVVRGDTTKFMTYIQVLIN
jgi:hypothetical protein